MDKIEEVIEQEFSKIIKKSAFKTKPKYTLGEILAEKTLHKLKELAKLHSIPRYSVLQREALISMLEKALTEAEKIEMCLFMADDCSLEELISLSKTLQMECSATTCARLDFYAVLGVIQVFYFEGKFLAVMPMEIREIVETVCTPSFMKRKKRDSLLLNYALACVTLYGFISQDEFVALFNKQNAVSTDIDEVFSTLIHHVSMDSDFCFWDEYIVSADFEDDDFEGLTHLIEATEGKLRYIPTKSQLLKYADGCFYEETIHTKQLEQYLKTLCNADHIAEDLTDEICYLATRDGGFDDIFHATVTAGLDFETMEAAQAFANVIINLKNNTRSWFNKGHTPNEMNSAFAKKPMPNAPGKILPFPVPAKSQKVGRNEPCPCGSGKKYKKCCGK